ncbi:MAG: ABC transporter permease subunit [Acidimicrobiia bacterium]
MKISSVFTKTLRDQRRPLLGWGIGVAALILVMSMMWPSVRGMPGLQDLVKHYPPTLKKIFNLSDYGTGRGYLNTELFSLMLPALFLVFGIGRGARLLAGEEEERTLDVLVSAASSRRRVLAEKAAGLTIVTMTLGLVLLVTAELANLVVGMDVAFLDLVRGTTAMTALALEFGFIALAVGAALGRRSAAIAVTTTIAVGAYALYLLSQLVTAVHPWRSLSAFSLTLDHGPIGPEWSVGYLTLVLTGVVVLLGSFVVFDRRDLGR